MRKRWLLAPIVAAMLLLGVFAGAALAQDGDGGHEGAGFGTSPHVAGVGTSPSIAGVGTSPHVAGMGTSPHVVAGVGTSPM